MSTAIHLPTSPAPANGLRIALIALASVEAFIALLQSLKLIAGDVQIGNGHLAGQLVATAHLVAAPILGIAALVFAALNRLQLAVLALAAIVLTTWASDLFSEPYAGVPLILLHVVRPVLAVLAIVLAVRRAQLGLAAALVASMWLVWAWASFLSDFLPFLFGVMIYGA